MSAVITPRASRLVTALAVVSAAVVLGASSTAAADPGQDDALDAEAWYALAEDAAEDAAGTDWAAIAASAGCALVDVEVTETVSAEINEALGAPDDLALPVVEREERCSGDAAAAAARTDGAVSLSTAAEAGSVCAGTDGPGQVCVARSGGYVTTSFLYSGSGTIRAFLKIYDIPTNASGCPTGASLATSSTASYSDGTRRSLSVYAPGYGGFAGHVWKYVGVGINTNWGGACSAL